MVAWTGLIKEVDVVQTEDGPDVVYVLQHHYYDWIEDFGQQREIILLSPRGEGKFKTTSSLKKDITAADLEDQIDPTHLLVVYGIPESVEQDIIVLDVKYIRLIDVKYYTTEKMDYGRIN